MPDPANVTADLHHPLSECPVLSRVVCEGEVFRFDGATRNPPQPRLTHLLARTPLGTGFQYVERDTPVLLLEGDKPRPLRECAGRHVWLEGQVWRWGRHSNRWWSPRGTWLDHGSLAAWPIVPPDHPDDGIPPWPPVGRITAADLNVGDAFCSGPASSLPLEVVQIEPIFLGRAPDGTIRSYDPNGPLRTASPLEVRRADTHPTVPREPDDLPRWEARHYAEADCWYVTDHDVTNYECGDEREARALADHLNATGWEPPAPEPERPTFRDYLIDIADPHGGLDVDGVDDWCAKHGYRVVDVQALTDAIGRLQQHRLPASHGMPAFPLVAAGDIDLLLDALGVRP